MLMCIVKLQEADLMDSGFSNAFAYKIAGALSTSVSSKSGGLPSRNPEPDHLKGSSESIRLEWY